MVPKAKIRPSFAPRFASRNVVFDMCFGRLSRRFFVWKEGSFLKGDVWGLAKGGLNFGSEVRATCTIFADTLQLFGRSLPT